MFELLRFFSGTAAVAFFIFTALLTYIFYDHEIAQVVSTGEQQNIRTARTLSNAITQELSDVLDTQPAKGGSDLNDNPELETLDSAIRRLTAGLPVVKVKFYALDGTTLYSSEYSQIGEIERDNGGFLAAAYQGLAVSRLSHRNSFSGFSQQLFNIEVVESYTPVFDADDQITSVFELYTDVTLQTQKINQEIIDFIMLVLLAFGSLYLVLFMIVHRADRLICAQYNEILSNNASIEDKNRELELGIQQRERTRQALLNAYDALEVTIEDRNTDLTQAIRDLEREINVRRKAEQELRLLTKAVEQSPASVFITDTDGIIQYVNPKLLEVTGYSREEVIGTNARLQHAGKMPKTFYNAVWDMISSGSEWRGEINNRKKNGEEFWETVSISPIRESDGSIGNFVAVKEDISLRKQYEEKLLQQANYDDLTGLANRLLTSDRLNQGILRARRIKQGLAVLLIDLDDFKKINDSLGHATGDQVLMETGRRMTEYVRELDTVGVGVINNEQCTVARLGGDEFVVLLGGLKDPLAAKRVAEDIVTKCADPFTIAGREIFISASVGIASFPADGDDGAELMRKAGIAMYQAKEEKGGAYRFFTDEYNTLAMERLDIETELRNAIAHEELALHYQPITDAKTGTTVGAEALLRWNNAKLGCVGPDRFIPVAECSRLILELGEWVIEQGLQDWATLQQRSGSERFFLSLNVSPRQFCEADFTQMLEDKLRAHQVAIQGIKIEITESLLVEEAGNTQKNLTALTEKGFCIAIDDFGTGYSALRYLKKMKVDTLKIDRSFITDVPYNTDDASLVSSISALAKGLGINVVAEGVETQEQLNFVSHAGCDLIQGWYTGKPVPIADFLSCSERAVG